MVDVTRPKIKEGGRIYSIEYFWGTAKELYAKEKSLGTREKGDGEGEINLKSFRFSKFGIVENKFYVFKRDRKRGRERNGDFFSNRGILQNLHIHANTHTHTHMNKLR